MTSISPNLNFPRQAQENLEAQLQPATEPKHGLALGEILIRLGYLKQNQIEKILDRQKINGGQFGETAFRLNFITQEQVHTALAMQYGYLREGIQSAKLPNGLIVIRNPNSSGAEQIRLLRTRLLTSETKERLNLFAIAPASYNVRAEFLACNLAASFAQLRRRVLLIDADLHKPRIGRFFKISPRRGLVNILSGDAGLGDVVSDSIVTNLSVLTAGPHNYNFQELTASDKLTGVLQQAQSAFDMVIVMTSPGGHEGEGRFAWSAAGAALVAARRDVTRRNELTSLAATLRQLDVDIIGAAMTR